MAYGIYDIVYITVEVFIVKVRKERFFSLKLFLIFCLKDEMQS